MIRLEELVSVGRINKTHGVQGELQCVLSADIEIPDFFIIEREGIPVPFFVNEIRRPSARSILIRFAGINKKETADALVGEHLYIKDEGTIVETGWPTMIGYTVHDARCGNLGEILRIDETTVNVLLEVANNGTPLLIPAHDSFITNTDEATRVLYMQLPEGLIDSEHAEVVEDS